MCAIEVEPPLIDRRTRALRRPTNRKSVPLASRIAACAFVVACGASGLGHAQSGILPIPVERDWYYEHEFALTPELRAQPRHTIVLDLERGDGKQKNIVNSIPYRVLEDRTFDLCIPKDDPYIRSMTLLSQDGGNTVLQVPRGAKCKTRTISAGLYLLQIEHDSRGIPSEGATAFVHLLRTKRVPLADLQSGTTLQAGETLQSSGTVPLDSTPCQGLTTDTAQSRPRNAFRTADGRWLFSGSNSAGTAQVDPSPGLRTAATVDLGTGGWTTCRNASGYYQFAIHKPSGDFNTGYLETDNVSGLDLTTLTTSRSWFEVADLGNFQVALDFYQSGNRWPIFVGSDNLLHWNNNINGSPSPAGQATPLTNAITYYPQGTAVPDLVEGEVALSTTNTTCGNVTTGTWVVRGDIPDINAISYTNPFTGEHLTLPHFGGLGHPGDSVRVGPRTVFQMFRDTFFTSPITYIGENQSCVWFQDQTVSFKVVPAEQWIVSTNECGTCNLSGIDLSNRDLSRSNFDYSTFGGANLTNTIFHFASLIRVDFSGSSTQLNGTDFSDADVGSSRFRNTDVSTTNMRSDAPLANSLDFTGATLSVNTMYPTYWRYSNDFTSATFKDSNGATLSSVASPLDLTNAKMRSVQIQGATLTGANLSGADFTGANLSLVGLESAFANTPATFNQATMTKASLKNAKLVGSFFRCASMSPTNLGGADLSGAWLEEDTTNPALHCGPTTLANSYMLNTRLTDAHLTNAVLDGVSWYNSSASGTASGENAFLNGASFHLADLPYLKVGGALLQNANLDNAVLIGADLSNAQATGANGNTANLRGTILTNANFSSANLTNAAVSTTQDSQIYLEVLVDPDRYQKPAQYQYFAVNRPPTKDTPNTANAICPNGTKGSAQSGCGAIGTANWIPTNPPQEPTDCQPSQYDSQGNVIAVTCSSSRHPAS